MLSTHHYWSSRISEHETVGHCCLSLSVLSYDRKKISQASLDIMPTIWPSVSLARSMEYVLISLMPAHRVAAKMSTVKLATPDGQDTNYGPCYKFGSGKRQREKSNGNIVCEKQDNNLD